MYTVNESPWSSSTGPSSPLRPSNVVSTGVRHDTTTIHWTVSRIAYTPENYTVHFGTSSSSLTPFRQQRQSGDNFTATNLPFSVQLTGLSAGTTYYYQVVAVNSVGSTASVEQSFTTSELRKLAKGHIQVFMIFWCTWCGPVVAGEWLLRCRYSCPVKQDVWVKELSLKL